MPQSEQLREYQLKEKDKTNEKQQSLMNMGDKNKRPSVCVIRVPEERKEGGVGKVLQEIVTENLPNVSNNINLWSQRAKKILNPNDNNDKW